MVGYFYQYVVVNSVIQTQTGKLVKCAENICHVDAQNEWIYHLIKVPWKNVSVFFTRPVYSPPSRRWGGDSDNNTPNPRLKLLCSCLTMFVTPSTRSSPPITSTGIPTAIEVQRCSLYLYSSIINYPTYEKRINKMIVNLFCIERSFTFLLAA